jgi:hypothetical protein
VIADSVGIESSEGSALAVAEKAFPLLIFAIEDAAQNALRLCQDTILREQIAASLELIDRSPERMRARENGEEPA